jgi:hypothetical protein
MKRLLIVLPLASMAIGLVLWLWHGSGGSTAPPGATTPVETHGPAAATHSQTPAPAPGPRTRPALQPQTGSIHLLVQSQGRGLPGAKVKFTAEESRENMDIETDAQGFQTLLGVPIGEYQVEARAPKHATKRVHAIVWANQTAELTLPLDPGSRLEGTVFDPSGRPLGEAHLNLMNPPKGIFMHPSLSAVSDAGGHYLIDGVPLADLDLHVYHSRYKPWLKREIPFRSPDFTLHEDVTLQEGTQLSGKVVDEKGAPLIGAMVMASNESIVAETTDAGGRFAIFGLGLKPIALKVQARGYATRYQQGVAPNSDLPEIRLARAGSFIGSLQADPLPDRFQISVYRFDPTFGQEVRLDIRSFSGTRGAFNLPDLEPGRYRLEAVAEGWEALEQPQIFIQEGSENAGARIRMARKK